MLLACNKLLNRVDGWLLVLVHVDAPLFKRKERTGAGAILTFAVHQSLWWQATVLQLVSNLNHQFYTTSKVSQGTYQTDPAWIKIGSVNEISTTLDN